jgi:hypothetical protein
MSRPVQVFGRRNDETDHALKRPATKKRQGTKSRAVGQWLAAGRYGELMSAPSPDGGRNVSTMRPPCLPQGCWPHVGVILVGVRNA